MKWVGVHYMGIHTSVTFDLPHLTLHKLLFIDHLLIMTEPKRKISAGRANHFTQDVFHGTPNHKYCGVSTVESVSHYLLLRTENEVIVSFYHPLRSQFLKGATFRNDRHIISEC